MPRYRLTLEYDGGLYHGLQAQAGHPSVQGSVERAVEAFCGETIRMHAAGRTDTGVHATGQVAHIDLTRDWPADVVRDALNAHLRFERIVVLAASLAAPDFHARFSAVERRYLYRILNRRAPAALDRGQVWHVPVPLDVEAMAGSAAVLVGRHDFNSFRSTACQSPTSIKTLDRLSVSRRGEEIHIEVASRSFLHNQVRILVGTLALVGRGQWSRRDVEEALAACDRTRAGPTAPPHGLCLIEVSYKSEAGSSVSAGGDCPDAEEPADDE